MGRRFPRLAVHDHIFVLRHAMTGKVFQERFGIGRFTTVLAEALLAEDRLEEAQHMAQQGLAMSRQAAFAYGVGLAQRVLGALPMPAVTPPPLGSTV